jgi:hypothetical protein
MKKLMIGMLFVMSYGSFAACPSGAYQNVCEGIAKEECGDSRLSSEHFYLCSGVVLNGNCDAVVEESALCEAIISGSCGDVDGAAKSTCEEVKK